jgi:orotate phosphoribosyltransferase
VSLHSLTNYSVLLDQALRSDYITEKDLLPLNEWRKDPAGWGVASKV